MVEEQLGKVASKIYLYSYPYGEGISQYKLLKYKIHTTKTSFNRVVEDEELVKRKYIDLWQIPDVGTKIYEKWMVRAKPDPLVHQIELKFKLNDLDKHILKEILSSDIFRKVIGKQLKKDKKIQNPLIYILSIFDIFIMTNEKMLFILKQLKKRGYKVKLYFKNAEDYDKYCKDVLPIIKDIIPMLMKGEKMKKDQQDLIFSVEDYMKMFIPPNTFNKINDGVTYIGELHNRFKKVHNKLDRMPKKFDKMMAEKAPDIIRKLSSLK